jgi:hypothetical protein
VLTLDAEDYESLGYGGIDLYELAAQLEDARRDHSRLRTGIYRKRATPVPKPTRYAQCKCCGKAIEQQAKKPRLYCSHACGSRKRYVRRSPNALRARKVAERLAGGK